MAAEKSQDEFYRQKSVAIPAYAGLAKEQVSVQKAIDLAAFHAEQGSTVYAIKLLESVATAYPKYARPYYGLIAVLLKKGNKKSARHWLDKLMTMPADVEQLLHASHAYIQIYDNVAYLQCLEKAFRLAPNNSRVLLDYASAKIQQGLDSEANRHLMSAIRLDTDNARAYMLLVGQNPQLLTESMQRNLVRLAGNSIAASEQHIFSNMALALCQRRAGNYAAEFGYLAAAKEPLKARRRWGFSAEQNKWQEIEALFSTGQMAENFSATTAIEAYQKTRPIILATLPRSGTTLLDKIVSSHSLVQSAEESGLFAGPALELASDSGFSSVNALLEKTDMAQYIEQYRESVEQSYQAMRLSASFITDKSLYNYRNIGVILTVFPEAKIIHCIRDYRDICLSCYQHYFPRGNPATLDLVAMAQLCSIFDEAMRFWKKRFPGKIIDVEYENLVVNPEVELRRVMTFCELPWEDACLKHHESKQTVHTASVKQVMQPINSQGLARWKNYETLLQPAIEELRRNGVCQ